ncbi:Hypothetical protein R9X50_00322200 [Acrodontium crateriforme]|uniref:Uncharacterized protein n=1 Tax=Acrodontium crateriforme TaxID=150365 RepID=A0AAQ3M3X9_9PEZI|nr:Hypothetical protein R9X50_00322200 [Acrodontium crateriforme]
MEDPTISPPASVPPTAGYSKRRNSVVMALAQFSFGDSRDRDSVSPTYVLGKRKSWAGALNEVRTDARDWAVVPYRRALKTKKSCKELTPDAAPFGSVGSMAATEIPRDSVVGPANLHQPSASSKGKGKACEVVAKFNALGDSCQKVWSPDIGKRSRSGTFPTLDPALTPFLDHADAIPEFRRELLGGTLGLDYQLQGWEREVFSRHTLENEIRRQSKISQGQELGNEPKNSAISTGNSTSMARLTSKASYTYEAPCYASIMREAYDPEPRQRRSKTQSSGTQSLDGRIVTHESRIRSEMLAAEYRRLFEPPVNNTNVPRPSADGKNRISEAGPADEENNEAQPGDGKLLVAKEFRDEHNPTPAEIQERLAGPSQATETDQISEPLNKGPEPSQKEHQLERRMQVPELEHNGSLEVASSDAVPEGPPQNKNFGSRIAHKLSFLISDLCPSLPGQDDQDDGIVVDVHGRSHRVKLSNFMKQVSYRWKIWRRSAPKNQSERFISEEPPRLRVYELQCEQSELQESCEATWSSLSGMKWVRDIHEEENHSN